jgi:uncharacterized protein
MNQGKKRGFATMSPEKRRAIAQQGGRAAHEKGVAHEFSREEARKAGERGGLIVSQNRAHMAEIGRKGARSAQRGSSSTINAPVSAPETRDLLKSATGNRTEEEHADEVERDPVEL